MEYSLQPPTAGAMGTELSKSKRRKGDTGHVPSKPDIISNQPTRSAVPPMYEDAPWAPGFNLAGRPDTLFRSEMGVQKQQTKVAQLFRQGALNQDSYLHFVIKSDKYEWIRFRRDSVSLLIYAIYKNKTQLLPGAPNYANATDVEKAEWHALRARTALPKIHVDPDVSGAGFFHRIEVSINGVPVPTNSAVGNLFLQSVRMMRLLGKNRKGSEHFCRASQMAYPGQGQAMNKALQRATGPFDYNSPLATTGALVPVYLDGIFPFDFKCQLMESIDNVKEPNLYFPPDTEIEIKMHLYRNKVEAIFMPEITTVNYFDNTNIVNTDEIQFTFQDVHLEYESVLLQPQQQALTMDQFSKGGKGFYDYDIIRGQHQSMPDGASYTQNDFQIMPWCRVFIVMFLPDWATFPMEAKQRPLSGFSRFPAQCSRIRLHFAGMKDLYFESGLVNPGFQAQQHQISKKAFYDYLTANRFTSFEFNDFFPKAAEDSYIQILPYDCRSLMSEKTEKLEVVCEFAAGTASPPSVQVCVLSIHPNGRAIVSAGSSSYSWIWEFKQSI